jgi:hypothetical protein
MAQIAVFLVLPSGMFRAGQAASRLKLPARCPENLFSPALVMMKSKLKFINRFIAPLPALPNQKVRLRSCLKVVTYASKSLFKHLQCHTITTPNKIPVSHPFQVILSPSRHVP